MASCAHDREEPSLWGRLREAHRRNATFSPPPPLNNNDNPSDPTDSKHTIFKERARRDEGPDDPWFVCASPRPPISALDAPPPPPPLPPSSPPALALQKPSTPKPKSSRRKTRASHRPRPPPHLSPRARETWKCRQRLHEEQEVIHSAIDTLLRRLHLREDGTSARENTINDNTPHTTEGRSDHDPMAVLAQVPDGAVRWVCERLHEAEAEVRERDRQIETLRTALRYREEEVAVLRDRVTALEQRSRPSQSRSSSTPRRPMRENVRGML